MKAIIHGFIGDKPVTLGDIRLRNGKLVYAIHPDCPDRDVARSILVGAAKRGMEFPEGPARFLEATPFLYDGAYCRATFVEGVGPGYKKTKKTKAPRSGPGEHPGMLEDMIEKDFDESQHPRAEDGKFGVGSGGRAPKTLEHEGKLPEQSYRKETTADEFITSRDKNPRREFLSDLTADDLARYQLVLNSDGTAGATVDPDGDIQNVFRNPGAPKGAGTAAVMEAIRRGGKTLDCYEYERKGRPGLPELYKKLGFIESGRMKFNAQYHPEWAKDGRTPDVVFMTHVGGDQSASPKSDRYYGSTDWEQAKEDSRTITKAYDETQHPRGEGGKFSGSGKFDAGVRSRSLPDPKMSVADQLRAANAHRRSRTPRIPADSPLGQTLDQEARWQAHHPRKTVTLEQENEKIAENKKTYGTESHRFEPAIWTAGNGHPRCRRCGDEEPMDGLCMPELQKWAAMLDTWSQKFAAEWNGRIELEGEGMSWIQQYHSKCIEKGAVCKVAWPLCPVDKSDSVAKYITPSGDKFKVHAESGKVLGTHDTRDEAEAQLRAIEANKQVEKIGWTDEARAAAAEARAQRAAATQDPTKNPYHKVLTQHGFQHVSTESKQNQFARNNPDANYTEHVYTHPERGKSKVIVTQYHAKTGPYKNDKLDNWRMHHEQENGIMAPTTGDTKPQLDRTLTSHYGEPMNKAWSDEARAAAAEARRDNARADAANQGGNPLPDRLPRGKQNAPRATNSGWQKANNPDPMNDTADHYTHPSRPNERLRLSPSGQWEHSDAAGNKTSGGQGDKRVPWATEKSEDIAPDDATIEVLKSAWQSFTKEIGLVFKSEDVMAEAVESNVFRIEAAGKRAYFAVENGQATRIEYTQKSVLVPVQKAEKQRYTLGAVYAPGETDFHGDTMTEVELEKAAWTFAQKDGLTGRVGLMHQSGTEKAGKVVESYIYRGPVWKMKDARGNEQTIVPGTWMLGVVWEPDGWAKIERNEINGYSLQGVARKFANGEEV